MFVKFILQVPVGFFLCLVSKDEQILIFILKTTDLIAILVLVHKQIKLLTCNAIGICLHWNYSPMKLSPMETKFEPKLNTVKFFLAFLSFVNVTRTV